MAETLQSACGGPAKWHWYSVMEDLKVQGGLEGVIINPLTVDANGCGGETKKGTRFFLTWMKNLFLLVSVSQEEPELIEAFAKVVEYRPFCRYLDEHGMLTFEWDKSDPNGHFANLQKGKVTKLQRIQ